MLCKKCGKEMDKVEAQEGDYYICIDCGECINCENYNEEN